MLTKLSELVVNAKDIAVNTYENIQYRIGDLQSGLMGINSGKSEKDSGFWSWEPVKWFMGLEGYQQAIVGLAVIGIVGGIPKIIHEIKVTKRHKKMIELHQSQSANAQMIIPPVEEKKVDTYDPHKDAGKVFRNITERVKKEEGRNNNDIF